MYGLFRFTYDWHEFQSLCAVSKSTEALTKRYDEIMALSKLHRPLIVGKDAHEEMRDMEGDHYCILPVQELP